MAIIYLNFGSSLASATDQLWDWLRLRYVTNLIYKSCLVQCSSFQRRVAEEDALISPSRYWLHEMEDSNDLDQNRGTSSQAPQGIQEHTPSESSGRSRFPRAKYACLLCRTRKVRCDSVQKFPCTNCDFHGEDCILVPRRTRWSVPSAFEPPRPVFSLSPCPSLDELVFPALIRLAS